MADLECEFCRRPVGDWRGKVVVDREPFEGPRSSVSHLRVACDDCFAGLAHQLHRLWELDWLKSNFVWVSRQFLDDLADDEPRTRWSREAVGDFIRLAMIALPDQAKAPTDP